MQEYQHASTQLPGDSIYTQPLRYEPASRKQRLVNYLVDTLLYYVFLFWLFQFTGHITVGDGTGASVSNDTTGPLILAYVTLPVLYTLFEALTKGRSPGKLITGTIAIRTDISPITFRNAVVRSLLRMLPFDPLTGLTGKPFHDILSKTVVVKKNSIVY